MERDWSDLSIGTNRVQWLTESLGAPVEYVTHSRVVRDISVVWFLFRVKRNPSCKGLQGIAGSTYTEHSVDSVRLHIDFNERDAVAGLAVAGLAVAGRAVRVVFPDAIFAVCVLLRDRWVNYEQRKVLSEIHPNPVIIRDNRCPMYRSETIIRVISFRSHTAHFVRRTGASLERPLIILRTLLGGLCCMGFLLQSSDRE